MVPILRLLSTDDWLSRKLTNALASLMWVSAFRVPISGRNIPPTAAKSRLSTIGARCDR